MVDVDGALEAAVVDGGHAHAGDAVHDLVGEALGHEPGADHPDADRLDPASSRALSALSTMIIEPLLRMLRAVRRVILRCELGSTSSSKAQARSLSEISVTGSGQVRPSRGSSYVQAALCARRVELADLVARLGLVLQHLVAVREALGHVERAVVVGGELDGDVLEVGRALRAQVDDDVENRAARAAHELRFRRRRILEVHAAQRALASVERDVGLRDDRLEPVLGEFVLAERAREETAVVLAALEVDDERALSLVSVKIITLVPR